MILEVIVVYQIVFVFVKEVALLFQSVIFILQSIYLIIAQVHATHVLIDTGLQIVDTILSVKQFFIHILITAIIAANVIKTCCGRLFFRKPVTDSVKNGETADKAPE